MKRRLLNVLTLLSLLLCVAVAVLWVRSYFVNERLNFSPHGDDERFRRYYARSGKGGFAFWIWGRDQPHAADYHLTWNHERAYWYPMQASARDGRFSAWNRMGFELRSSPSSLMATAPYGSVEGPLLVLPCLYVVRRLKRRRRSRKGLCPSCGYDLRASRERCPECGTSSETTEAAP
jgi:hypothetical protein